VLSARPFSQKQQFLRITNDDDVLGLHTVLRSRNHKYQSMCQHGFGNKQLVVLEKDFMHFLYTSNYQCLVWEMAQMAEIAEGGGCY